MDGHCRLISKKTFQMLTFLVHEIIPLYMYKKLQFKTHDLSNQTKITVYNDTDTRSE